jgi:AmpD protein
LPPGEYGGDHIAQLFTNTLPADAHPYFAEIHQLEVSAHVLIRRDGTVAQFVPFNKRAWHAGESCYRGNERCNDFSIGIELEGTDTDSFENAQYESLVELVTALCKHYPSITTQRIAGHSDIAPGRKTDPGSGFDWDRLSSLLA